MENQVYLRCTKGKREEKENKLFSVIRTLFDRACRTDQEYHRFIYFESSFDQKIFEIQIT